LAEAPVVTPDMLQLPEHEPAGPTSPRSALGSLDDLMRQHLAAALQQTDWNISRTAALLGISRNTVRARVRKFGLQTDAEPATAPLKAEPKVTPAAQSATVPSAVAPTTIRWGTRRITLLRVMLLAAENVDTTFDMSRALEILVDKVQSFGGHVEELSQRGIG